jgi:hypothetical protein
MVIEGEHLDLSGTVQGLCFIGPEGNIQARTARKLRTVPTARTLRSVRTVCTVCAVYTVREK